MAIDEPKVGDDVRVLHRTVSKLITGINAVGNMTGTWAGRMTGYGRLAIRGSDAEMIIKVSDPGPYTGEGQRLPVTMLIISSNPQARINTVVVFTASVRSSDNNPMTGTVQFDSDGAVFAISGVDTGGDAVGSTSLLMEGNHTITATYSGDAFHEGGNVSMVQIILSKLSPNMGFLVAPNPALHGATVEFVASLPNDAAGEVEFFVGVFGIGAGVVSGGLALYVTTADGLLVPGLNQCVAIYSGDTNYDGDSVTTWLNVSAQAATTVDVVSDNNPAAAEEESITWTATITGLASATPTGTVQFYSDGAPLKSAVSVVPSGTAGVAIAELTVAPPEPLSGGSHALGAYYSGDVANLAGWGEMTQVILVVPPITVGVADLEPYATETLHLWAIVEHVSGFAAPTGNVRFLINGIYKDLGTLHAYGAPLDTAADSSEEKWFSTGGDYIVRAEYEGDGTYAGRFDQASFHVYDLATAYNFDSWGYVTLNAANIVVGWNFALHNPSTERSPAVGIHVVGVEYLSLPYGTQYPMTVYFNAGQWTPKPEGDPDTQQVTITCVPTGGWVDFIPGSSNSQTVIVTFEVQFADGHIADAIYGSGGGPVVWNYPGPGQIQMYLFFYTQG